MFLTVDLSLCVLCLDLPNRSILTERTSDNQRLGTSNDTTYVAEHPDWKVNWIEVLTICWPVFRVDKTPIDESAGKQLRDVNVAR